MADFPHTVVIIMPHGHRSDGCCWDCGEYSQTQPLKIAVWDSPSKVTLGQLCCRCFLEKGWNAHYYRSHPETEALV